MRYTIQQLINNYDLMICILLAIEHFPDSQADRLKYFVEENFLFNRL